ncbi:zinc ribbon domain-containing protein, partial [Rhodosalinus sp.]|uniref:zinc ribbon domain-containing protein n=1 Tax=Rhodosalinus sp. TaxID=2047741 RepID=UPI003978B081
MRYAHRERPELQIIDDDLWNEVQTRLEAIYEQYAKPEPDRRSLNGAHRAKYLLARLITCDCCGAGYTIVAEDRYGCYGRKTRGVSVCSNSKTISRFRLEERVLARLRQGLLTPELAAQFAAQFAAEVQRLWRSEDAAKGAALLESASVMRRPERTSLAPTRSTRSR